jgi:hypothetical protein
LFIHFRIVNNFDFTYDWLIPSQNKSFIINGHFIILKIITYLFFKIIFDSIFSLTHVNLICNFHIILFLSMLLLESDLFSAFCYILCIVFKAIKLKAIFFNPSFLVFALFSIFVHELRVSLISKEAFWTSLMQVCMYISNAGFQPQASILDKSNHMKTEFAKAIAFLTCVLYILM